MDEHFHSTFGALNESMHIFINNGLNRWTGSEVSVLEIGFGTGLNAFLTAIEARKKGRRVNYTAIEKFPVERAEWSQLNYPELTGKEYIELFRMIHEADWEVPVGIDNTFTLCKIEGDLTKMVLNGNYNVIYFDAFAPSKQPEMWSDRIFSMISECTVNGGILSTYSSSGKVRRSLGSSGFEVKRVPGPEGKRDITVAIKV